MIVDQRESGDGFLNGFESQTPSMEDQHAETASIASCINEAAACLSRG